MFQRLLMLCGLGSLGLLVAGCLFDGGQAPASQAPVVVPVINNQSDNSGMMVLIAVIIVGLVVGLVVALVAYLRADGRRRDAEHTTQRILDALPDEVYEQIGPRRVLRTAGLDVEIPARRSVSAPTPARRAIGGGR